jgi:hypothetical protein
MKLIRSLFEDRVLKKVLAHRRKEATGRLQKFHDEDFRDLLSSPGIIGMIKI